MTTKKIDIYFLIDISGSMLGEPIDSLNSSLNKFIENLKIITENVDKRFDDLIQICILSYNKTISENLPLVNLMEIQNIQIGPAFGPTYSGEAIEYTNQKIFNSIISQQSYYNYHKSPLFFHLTDGNPSDIQQYNFITNKQYKNINVNKIACAIGQAVDIEYLKKFSRKMIVL